MRRILLILASLWLFCGPALAQPSYGNRKVSLALDQHSGQSIKENKLTPAPRAGDAELVRRIYLDLLGRIPTSQETTEYLQDKAPDKHHRLIDTLLDHWEFTVHWRDVLALWLLGREENPGQGHKEFLAYLQQGLAKNKTWDQFAREMLVPSAEPEAIGAAYFLATRLRLPKEEQLDGMTVAVGSNFFGVRVECARCHDHPYVGEWKQDHYYGLASFLSGAQVSNKNGKAVLAELAAAPVSFNTKKNEKRTAQLMFLDGKVFNVPAVDKKVAKNAPPAFSRLKALADYALTPENPYFKRALVNRVWKQLLGRGLVNPVDQIHKANPPSHPEVFDLLTADFAGNSFDLKRLIGNLMHSETYLRSSAWTGKGEQPDRSLYAVALLRPLSPEQLALSVMTATGHGEVIAAKVKNARNNPAVLRAELEKEYKPFIALFHSESAEFSATTAQALFLTFNKGTQKFLQPAPGNLTDRLAKLKNSAEIARLAYLAVLSREPSAEEVNVVTQYLQDKKQPAEKRRKDLVWALLTSAEFRFNH